jgi:protein disulfide-isomerase-like protein
MPYSVFRFVMASFLLMSCGCLFADMPQAGASAVLELNAETFDGVVLDPKRDVFVKFYAPWCGHCQRFAPQWEALAQLVQQQDLDVAIVALDATRYTEKARQHNVHGYPTVKLYTRRNKEGQLYDASREPAQMLKFLKKSIGDQP